MRPWKTLQLFLSPAKVACDQAEELAEMDRVLGKVVCIDQVLELTRRS